MMPTATITPPADLVELKADWLAAEALSARIASEESAGEKTELHLQSKPHQVHEPSAAENWLTLQSEDQRARHDAARAELMRLTLAIADHEWWATLPFGSRLDAEIAVRRTAQGLYDAERAVPSAA
jgi:hypothetical protein